MSLFRSNRDLIGLSYNPIAVCGKTPAHSELKRMEKLIMKRMAMFFVCVSSGFAGYSDGFITAGEYEYAVRWSNSQIPLIVDGGGGG
jgi:hypothetical protein